MPAAALAALLALPLSACTTAAQDPPPTHTASASPLFTSDADALKAATDAYAAYQRTSDEIAHDGGADPERITTYVTQEQLTRELEGFAAFRTSNRHTTGKSTFDSATLARRDLAHGELEMYLCQDLSKTKVLDEHDSEVRIAGRRLRLPMDIQFVRIDGKLLISRSEVWSGKDFC
jgi:hypothetical protein